MRMYAHTLHTRAGSGARASSAVRRTPDSQSTWIDAQPDVRDRYSASRARHIQAFHTSLFIFYLLTRRADRAHATHGSLWASRDARTYNILNHPRVEGRTGELNSDVPQEHTQLRTDAQMAHRASTVAAAYMAGLADQVAERYPNTNRIGTTRATEQPSGCGPARLGQLRCTGPMAV